MVGRSDWRRLTVRRRNDPNGDDRPDDAIPLDEVWAEEAKRTRRRQRARKALETAIDTLYTVQDIGNWW